MRTAAVLLSLLLSALLAQAQPTPQPPKPTPRAAAPAQPKPTPRAAAPAQPKPTPRAAAPTEPKPAPRAAAPARPKPAPTGSTMTVEVTDRQGKPLADVEVGATGPADRDATTDAEGHVVFRNMGVGTYRLRFEHPAFVTFEREVSMPAGRALRTSAALNPASSRPRSSEQGRDDPPPPAPQLPPPGSQPATMVSIPEVFEANTIGRNPSLTSLVGCAGLSTARLIQLREPLEEHTHDDAEEALYVVAGQGSGRVAGNEVSLTAGTLIMVPRGTPHNLTREGRGVLVLLSIQSGPPCTAQ